MARVRAGKAPRPEVAEAVAQKKADEEEQKKRGILEDELQKARDPKEHNLPLADAWDSDRLVLADDVVKAWNGFLAPYR